jgi:SAGA-associated factor 29
VACKLTLDNHDKTLILAEVVQYRSEINSYEVLDVDDQQKYVLPQSQVFELGLSDSIKRLSKSEIVYALYPDTTIFYPATIVQVPRRSNQLSSEVMSITVQFQGDEDIDGVIPSRTIPLKYVVRAPQFL